MATNFKDYLSKKRKKHTVGQVNSYNFDTVINGAICEEDLDNFTMGELFYEEVEGVQELKVKKATDDCKAHDAVLLVTPEERVAKDGIQELLSDFYNGEGERATCAILAPNFTFETSAIDASGVSDTPKVGQYATWDNTAGKFKLKADTDDTEVKLFRVVDITEDPAFSIDGEILVMLSVLR